MFYFLFVKIVKIGLLQIVRFSFYAKAHKLEKLSLTIFVNDSYYNGILSNFLN